jgi:hypothetical protein
MPDSPPHEYSRPDGNLTIVEVTEATYKRLKKLATEEIYGIRTGRSLNEYKYPEQVELENSKEQIRKKLLK